MKKVYLSLLGILFVFFAQAQLTPVSNFGSDPGNLNMYTYIPSNMPSNAPVVLVLHGCSQSASSYASESDWNSLADEYKFYVIYAEQTSANNSYSCFNWFENGDKTRGYGEARSLKSMVDYMKNNYSVDANRVFVTGFSAGGAMTTVMLATYPEVFSAGGVMSGLPYDVATGSNAAFQAMYGNVNLSPTQLGNKVRNASNHNGPWPTVAIFHGTSDYTVYYMNENEIMEQWTNVHGTDQSPEVNDPAYLGNSTVLKKEYHDASGNPVVVSYSFDAMGHTIAIDPGNGPTQGGNSGSYTKDVNFWSSYYAAEHFGLLGPTLTAPTNISATAASYNQINLSWTDNESSETGYIVERSTSASGPFSTIANLGTNSTAFSDTGLNQLTTYYYKISVTDGSNTAAGDIVSATTPSDGTPTPPQAPSNLSAASTGQTSISLTWVDNSNNEDSFVLERSTGNESNYAVIATLSSNVTSYNDGGLTSETTYYYRVKAQNGAGASSYSSSANATTDAEATIVTIEQLLGTSVFNYSNNHSMGQSFTSIATGEIISIDVNLYLPISGSTLKVYQGNTVSGTPIYQQSGVSAGSGWQTITLNNPMSVSNGQQYTFQLTNASLKYRYSNVYNGGNFWYNNISYGVFDAAFKVAISTTNPGGRVATEHSSIAGNIHFNIYPNPSKGNVKMNIDGIMKESILEIWNIDGRLLQTFKVSNGSNDINLSKLPHGIYHTVLISGETTLSRRLIIR